jgi:hypothetical protein
VKIKNKAGIALVAIVLGLVVSPAVAIEDSSLAQNQTNFIEIGTFFQKENSFLPSDAYPFEQKEFNLRK